MRRIITSKFDPSGWEHVRRRKSVFIYILLSIVVSVQAMYTYLLSRTSITTYLIDLIEPTCLGRPLSYRAHAQT